MMGFSIGGMSASGMWLIIRAFGWINVAKAAIIIPKIGT